MVKKTSKSDRINARLSPDIRLGAELLASKYSVGLSTIVEKAVHDLIKREGLLAHAEGDPLSLLERLQTLRPGARLLFLDEHKSDMLSSADRVWISNVKEMIRAMGGRAIVDEHGQATEEDIEADYEAEHGIISPGLKRRLDEHYKKDL